MKIQTAERANENSIDDSPVFKRQLFAYEYSAQFIKGTVLEIGCGEGYGAKYLSKYAEKYIGIDKYKTSNLENIENIEFIQTKVPYLTKIKSNSIDVVVCFQVIEHIKKDYILIKEINRVLKKGGIAIISTPNIKMSLTRNPFHVREYTILEFNEMVSSYFSIIKLDGVFGDEVFLKYHEENRISVEKFRRYDIFNFEKWLPSCILRIPYDIL
ncbi:MAG: hypothetical protein A2X12_02495, partial [Bacteroidetes bacterium GWE2_29_8]